MLPSATERCGRGIMFSGCPSVSACVRACVLFAIYFTNQQPEFHQTLVGDVVERADKPIRF